MSWGSAAWAQSTTLPQYLASSQMVEVGRKSFVANCSGCHGLDAKGVGPGASILNPKPRNLVEGSFKFRSTPSGSYPTSEDLYRTLDQGVLGTSMPNFKHMPQTEKLALVAYLRSLRKDWNDLQAAPVMLPRAPSEIFAKKETLLASAVRGEKLFQEGCATCHGTGIGDGKDAAGLTDNDGRAIKPANLTRPYIKSGRTAEDIFKAITTGLDGTPMPAFLEVYSVEQRWDLVAWVMYRRGQGMGLYEPEISAVEAERRHLAAQNKAVPAAAPVKTTTPTQNSQTPGAWN